MRLEHLTDRYPPRFWPVPIALLLSLGLVFAGQLATMPRIGSAAPAPAPPKTPLILIPGITGSQLDSATRTGLFSNNYWPGFGSGYGALSLRPGDRAAIRMIAPDVVRYIFPSVRKMPGYGPLIEMLTDPSRGGYIEYDVAGKPERRTAAGCDTAQAGRNPTLFIFAYDFRLTNTTNAALLKEYVDCIQRFYPGTNVNIVAHSMGGIISRRYILDNPGTHRVDKLLTFATPWLGAPKSVVALETGEVVEWYLSALGAKSIIRDLARFWPAAHELFPNAGYFELGGRPLTVEQPGQPGISYTYGQMVSYLNGSYSDARPADDLERFFGGRSALYDWRQDNSSVRYYQIIGLRQTATTIGNQRVVFTAHCRKLFLFFGPLRCTTSRENRVSLTMGDDTVPTLSLLRQGNGLNYNAPSVQTKIFQSGSGTGHGDIQLNPAAWTAMLNALDTGSFPTLAAADERGSYTAGTSAELPAAIAAAAAELDTSYSIWISGAITATVVDTLGRTTDPLSSTVAYPPDDPPDVGMTVLGERSYQLAIPASETFTVTLSGIDQPLQVEILTQQGLTVTHAIRYLDVDLPADTRATLRLMPAGPEGLIAAPPGAPATLVTPTAVLTGTAATDVDPPTVAITRTVPAAGSSPSVQAAAGLSPTVTVSLTADDPAGVVSLYYSVDGGVVFEPYTSPVTLDPAAVGDLYVLADDAAGNRQVDVYALVADAFAQYLPFVGRQSQTGGSGW